MVRATCKVECIYLFSGVYCTSTVDILMVSIPDCKLVLMRLLEYNDCLEIWNGGMGFSPIPYPDVVMNLYSIVV